MAKPFPNTMDFAGWNAPSRIECDIYDLVTEGEVPEEINGSWYRSIPDPQYSPMLGDDTFLSGDGMVSLFRFENGHVDFKMRYVKTERWKAERAARRSLYGKYRNPFTDDPSVQGKPRNVNNTTPIYHAGKLLALKEDSHAMELDPHTLETIGEWDYDGKLKSQTMTAHTRLAPDTGDLYFFGYEAGGLVTKDVSFCVADKKGNLTREEWFEAPYVALMHDFAVTREHVIFPVFPITADLNRMKAGGHHWVFEQDKESFVGILPRDAHVKHMRWFRGPARSSFHFMNAFSEGNRVHMYFGVSKVPPFPFMQEASGIHLRPDQVRIGFVRWTFDLSKPGDTWEETVIGPSGDMPRTALKDQMTDFDIGYYQTFDPQQCPEERPAADRRTRRRGLQHHRPHGSEDRKIYHARSRPNGHRAGAYPHSVQEARPRRLPGVRLRHARSAALRGRHRGSRTHRKRPHRAHQGAVPLARAGPRQLGSVRGIGGY